MINVNGCILCAVTESLINWSNSQLTYLLLYSQSSDEKLSFCRFMSTKIHEQQIQRLLLSFNCRKHMRSTVYVFFFRWNFKTILINVQTQKTVTLIDEIQRISAKLSIKCTEGREASFWKVLHDCGSSLGNLSKMF